MQKNIKLLVSVIASACVATTFAAKPINLRHESMTVLKPLLAQTMMASSGLKEVNRAIDRRQTKHIRLKQWYAGVPVFGSDVIMHIPSGGNTLMNGIVYQELNNDLGATPPTAELDKAIQAAMAIYKQSNQPTGAMSQAHASRMIYVDLANKAHWSYEVSFFVSPKKGLPANPHYVLDANTLEVYAKWDNVVTLENVSGGGFGGNEKEGEFIYDGIASDYPQLAIKRDAHLKLCYLENADVIVKDHSHNDAVSQFACALASSEHGNAYWDADFDAVNGAYSPSNDALFVGRVIQDMYKNWYHTPALIDEHNQAMMLVMRVHEDLENAYWYQGEMTFGDGGSMFYPLVSLGVGAHEISHGFTEQHSGLINDGQAAGLNEAFSDMAAQAAEFYANGHNSWQIGPEIMKQEGALRYMDEPTKDCNGNRPGDWCSIDHVRDYTAGLDQHYSCGVFNKAFYLMGSQKNWDAHKAFDVMVQANRYYWTPNTTFAEAACGVVQSAIDLQYDRETVQNAFKAVGIDTTTC